MLTKVTMQRQQLFSMTQRMFATIKVGDAFPSAKVGLVKHDGGSAGYQNSTIDVAEYLANKKAVLVAIPGAFTPTCMGTHLPEFIRDASKIKAGGVDEIICLTVNDPWVTTAFAEKLNGKQHISYIADGNGELCKKLGLEFDVTAALLGHRMRRASIIVSKGKVIEFNDENGGKLTEVSCSTTIIKQVGKK